MNFENYLKSSLEIFDPMKIMDTDDNYDSAVVEISKAFQLCKFKDTLSLAAHIQWNLILFLGDPKFGAEPQFLEIAESILGKPNDEDDEDDSGTTFLPY